MNLNDETFPEDKLFDNLPCHSPTNSTECEQNTFSTEQDENSFLTSEGTSFGIDCQLKSSAECKKKVETSKSVRSEKYSKKSCSHQDLHSIYTKKRYQHVKSKVKEYIENFKAEEEERKARRIIRQKSLPETLSSCNEFNKKEINTEDQDIFKNLLETEKEVTQLRTLNEYLHNSLQEKLAQVARLQRTTDYLRFELSEIKEKERKQNSFNLHRTQFDFRRSLPIIHQYSEKVTNATQTGNSLRSSPSFGRKNRRSRSDYSLDSNENNVQRKARFHLKKRSNSNREDNLYLSEDKATSSDNNSTIESETDTECHKDPLKRKNSVLPQESLNKKNKCKSRKLKKGWKLFFKSCSVRMSCCNSSGILEEEYCQLPQTENEFTTSTGVQV